MAMNVTYQSTAYAYTTDDIKKRYVKRDNFLPEGIYSFCEVGEDRRYDIRQGTVTGDELPAAVREAADKAAKEHCHYVSWPL